MRSLSRHGTTRTAKHGGRPSVRDPLVCNRGNPIHAHAYAAFCFLNSAFNRATSCAAVFRGFDMREPFTQEARSPSAGLRSRGACQSQRFGSAIQYRRIIVYEQRRQSHPGGVQGGLQKGPRPGTGQQAWRDWWRPDARTAYRAIAVAGPCGKS
jgi:hypothetical protein